MTAQIFIFDGETIAFRPGETLAAAIVRAGQGTARLSYFCGIGACQSCTLWCEGRRVEACITLAKPDMIVSSTND